MNRLRSRVVCILANQNSDRHGTFTDGIVDRIADKRGPVRPITIVTCCVRLEKINSALSVPRRMCNTYARKHSDICAMESPLELS